MDVFIARQPIFNKDESLYGYELLYRDSATSSGANISDEDFATSSLVSYALTVFGMSTLTGSKPAFINFTQQLILDDFALILPPKDVVIEILENIQVTDEIIKKIKYLKKKGYTIALDDYVGNKSFDTLLPYANIIKADFSLLNEEQRKRLAIKFKHMHVTLLAEKVETYQEFVNAVEYGYTLFQGYFFARPKTISKKTASVSSSISLKAIKALNEPEPRFSDIAKIIQTDAVLTYKLLQVMNTMRYYRGFQTNSVLSALVRMGIVEARRWLLLMLAKETSNGKSEELIKISYIRAIFMQRLAEACGLSKRSEDAFLMGILSLMDIIMETSIDEILQEIVLPEDIRDALLGKTTNVFSYILSFIKQYETCDKSDIAPISKDFGMTREEILSLYIECLFEADQLFNDIM